MKILIRFIVLSFGIVLSSHHLFAEQPELVVQTGHSAFVNSVVFSPDGKILASGSNGQTIKLWDVETGRELRTLKGIFVGVNSIVFSPKENIIACGNFGGSIELWNAETGQEILTLRGHQRSGIVSVAFSPDGKIIAGGGPKIIKFWEVGTGVELSTLKGHSHWVRTLAFSPDGKILASGSGDMTGRKESDNAIRLWDVSTGRELRVLSGHTDDVESLAFSPDGKVLASGSSDYTIKLWEVVTGKEIGTLTKHSFRVTAIAFSPDGKILASRSGDGTIRLSEVATGKELNVIVTEGGYDCNISFSPNGKILASGIHETIKLWEVTTGEELRELTGHSGEIRSIAFSPDGKILACGPDFYGGRFKRIRLWELYSAKVIRTFAGNFDWVSSLVFSPNGKILASAAPKEIVLWDVNTGEKIRELKGPSGYGYIEDISFNPDGRILASVGSDSTIKLWDVNTGKEIRTLTGHRDVRCVDFSSDGKILSSGSSDSTIKVWKVSTGKELRTLKGHSGWIYDVAFSPVSKILASGSQDKTIKLWNVDTGKELSTLAGHSQGVYSLAFSPDGKILASAGGDIKLWEPSKGKELCTLTGPSDFISSVVFSLNGNILAGVNGTKIKLWDVKNRKELVSLIALDEKDWVVITPDGRFDGSPEGLKKMHYVQNNQPIPLDAFFEQFYTPNLLAQVVSGKLAPMKQTSVDFSKAIKLPPLITITSPQAGESFNTEAISITVEAVDQGGGIDEIRLYQNGKLFSEEQRGIKIVAKAGSILTRTYNITLLPGINEFRATAFNTDRTESNPAEIRVELKAAQASANLYLLAIGISEYQNSSYKLNYGKADAQAFADAVSQRGKGIFKQINQQMIFDAEATRESIEAAFNNIVAAAKPQDAFIFFYAGHGVMSEGDATTPPEFYLVPSDVTKLYGDDALLAARAVSARRLKELCTRIPAQKQLVVLDACQAAGALESFALRGAAEEKAILQLARSAGVVVLAATGTEQSATEFGKLGHGVFTFALLQGLAGEADGGSPPDGKITVKELEAYLNDKVPELTKQYRGTAQYPHSYARGQDFPMGVVK